jgi:hypothetical protein
MKNKRVLFFIVLFIAIFALSSHAETKKLKSIGQYTFVRIRGRVPTQEVMKMLVDRYSADIKYGFDMAGASDLYLPFMDQLKSSSFEEKSLPVGDTLYWMLFRSHGKVKVAMDIEWAGKAPLDVFAFTVKKDFKAYEFVMPRPCGNISLRSITELELPPAVCALTVSPAKVNLKDQVTIDMGGSQQATSMEVDVLGPDGQKLTTYSLTPEAARKQTSFDKPGIYTFKGRATNAQGKVSSNSCEAKLVVNAPPVCSLQTSCSPCKNMVGRPITIDASGSKDPDGQVAKADFSITDTEGNPVDKFMDSDAPFIWDKIFDKPGTYAITVVVTDDFGAVSEPCRLVLEVTQKRSYIGVEAGPFFARGSHGPYMFAMVGWQYWLTPDKLDFSIWGGGALSLKSAPWKSIFLAEALLNYHAGAFFIGGGAGMTTAIKEGRDADFDLIGNFGFDLFKNPQSTGALSFQVRWPIGSGRTFADNHKFGFGFRYCF